MNATLALRDRVEVAEHVAPRRPRLLALGVGVAAGAVGAAVGMSINLPTQPLADNGTSLQQEHLAQASVVAGFPAAESLAKEHLAQAPGGLAG